MGTAGITICPNNLANNQLLTAATAVMVCRHCTTTPFLQSPFNSLSALLHYVCRHVHRLNIGILFRLYLSCVSSSLRYAFTMCCRLVRAAHVLLSFVPPPEPVFHFHVVLAESRHRRTRLFHSSSHSTSSILLATYWNVFPAIGSRYFA